MGFFDAFRKRKAPADHLTDLMARLRAALEAGKHEEALRQSQLLIEAASAAGDRMMEAAGLQRRGVVKDMLGHTAEAEVDVRRALAIDLELEGADGFIVRQDHYTLGIILARLGRIDEGIAALTESARIAAVLNDDDAELRALTNVANLCVQQKDIAGAIAVLWPLRPGANRRRAALDSKVMSMLAELLVMADRFDDVLPFLAPSVGAIGYWGAKEKMGRVGQEVVAEAFQAAVDLHVLVARQGAAAGRRDLAASTLDSLDRLAGRIDPAGLKALRDELLAEAV